jgi:RNA polymerase sigma-54 factor
MADHSLQLRLTQKLSLAPQLQQAIRLLQLNRIELREYIQDALDANPILERTEPGSEQTTEGESGDTQRDEGDYTDQSAMDSSQADASDDWGDSAGDAWLDTPSYRDPGLDPQIADPSENSLLEHLLWQINLAHFSPADTMIATAIIYGLDDDGFLAETIEEIRLSLMPELLVEEDEILAVLHRIQRMEPVGVASRDTRECIRVQLAVLPADTPGRELATRITRDFLDLVADGAMDQLRKSTRADQEALTTALDLIVSLEPRPGSRYDNRRDEYLVPDVYLSRSEDEWRISLNPDNDPGLKLNRYYIDLLRKSGGEDAKYLKGRLQEARWLMSSLEMRNQTLIRVAQSIVDFQEDFLEQGEIGMKPLVLREVAEAIGVHESTVSRATTRKYMLTPRGVYELKYFFSSHVHTDQGGVVSATSVKARIQTLLEMEKPEQPLSDNDVSEILRSEGIRAARRTVAKYRESLGIGSSSERRKLYRRLSHSPH